MNEDNLNGEYPGWGLIDLMEPMGKTYDPTKFSVALRETLHNSP